MSANSERVRTLIGRQAADWFIANRAGLSGTERNAFTLWLKASPVHVEEYLAISVIGRDLREACAYSAESLDKLLARARLEQEGPAPSVWPRERVATWRSWRTATFATAVAGVLTIGSVIGWRSLSPVLPFSSPVTASVLRIATRHGEQLTRRLADDSVLHLNTDSSITVQYSKAERLVRLTSGEAFFEVAHEPSRSFRVLAGSAQIVAIGTQFNVRLAEHATVITVLQGQVAAGPSGMGSEAGTRANPDWGKLVPVAAGQQIRVAEDQRPAQPNSANTERTTAWLHRQIMFEREPLQRVAAEFNRYALKPIEIVTPALQDLEISGVFATDDTDAFVAFLRSLDGVHVEVSSARIRVSQQ
jgi:transmembrane sensor